jgi:predicted TIM-barrel fold metal-dependent hydrolase
MRTDPITLDCDVLCGAWPARADLDFGLPAVRKRLDRAGITGAVLCSGRGAWFDDIDGNTETLAGVATLAAGRFVAAGTLNLRNALRAEAELDRLVLAGVRAIRLFGPLQGCEPGFPGYRHIVEQILDRGLLTLVEGDIRQCWRVFAERGARVVFLDVHAYHLADFILLARREPGFVASTRLLNAPDSIESVVGDVGPAHLAFGSRTPLHETSPAVLRMRHARLSDADWAAVAGGTLRGLLETG